MIIQNSNYAGYTVHVYVSGSSIANIHALHVHVCMHSFMYVVLAYVAVPTDY